MTWPWRSRLGSDFGVERRRLPTNPPSLRAGFLIAPAPICLAALTFSTQAWKTMMDIGKSPVPRRRSPGQDLDSTAQNGRVLDRPRSQRTVLGWIKITTNNLINFFINQFINIFFLDKYFLHR